MACCNTRTLYIRKAISQALDKIWEYPLTVVEAPMGYGKTTAVREYLKGCKAKVLWQTVVNDAASAFWCEFSRLFAKLDAEAAVKLSCFGVPQNSSCMLEAMEIITHIQFGCKTVIVLDDYHFLTSAYIDQFIEVLIKNLPDNLHIVIVSRV